MRQPRPKRPAAGRAPQPAPDTRNLAARTASLDAVLAVEEEGQALDGALNAQPGYSRLEPRDRAFARAIAAAAIRRWGALESAVNAFLDRPLPEREARARAILRLAAAELLVLDNAPHAVVDAYVALMGEGRERRKFKNLANAVLRKVATQGREPFDAADPLDDLPGWLAARWAAAYGKPAAQAMAAARSGPPPLDLTVKPGADAAALAEAIGGTVLPTGTVRREGIGDVSALTGYEAGEWWAQDAAAALPAALLAPQTGERIADLCAAPGGKTLQLAAAGSQVIALDRSEKRLKRVSQNLARTGLSAEIVVADGTEWRPEAPFDAVLLDAPCSATGTLRRRPDVAWTKTEADIASLAALQSALLDNAFAMLRPGGRLVFCTCSLEPEEGEDQIAAFLARTPEARLDPVRPAELPGLAGALRDDGTVRTRPDLWPETGGLDGFFIARVTRA
ncbi:RsmB/NOP family class I SAM-dependent RNA methyltransferase [Glycocaulis profundi]|nr:RsmB/NOP family class I SAM-dependent RNA methyltransferase [Glycocaulis profundi]